MTDEIIIDGIKYFKQCDINKGLDEEHYVTEFHLLATHYNLLLEDYARKYNSLKEQLKRKEQECEELHSRTASIIYNLTGGRLSYSTYTLEGCADAYRDQLSIDVEKATKELEEENETLKQEVSTLEQALDEIYNVIFIDDIHCEVSKEVQDLSNAVINIINKAKE